MSITIKNNELSVEISTLGGELMSVKSGDGTEYLWQGDPAYWTGRAYNLFPIVGRLTEGKYTYNGKTYEMNLHGFIRKSELKVASRTSDSVVFEKTEDETTLSVYPFRFTYRIDYRLRGNRLSVCYEVINTGEEPLIFGVGGHPGFNVPLGGNEAFEDYYLEFDCAKPAQAIVMSPACFLTDKTAAFPLKEKKIIELRHDLFDNDAIVLQNMCKKITLKSKTGSRSVTVEYPDMKYLGLWHKPKTDAPYVCIEPWSSLPSYDSKIDDFETKRDMEKLSPGKTYANRFDIIIK
ncbi:MAG: aldose 1-epimerase family protein [Christensenellales bacterium]|jgi:galactose mutarotase-like enzyme